MEKMMATIRKHNMIERGNCIVVGLSGGPDSLAMLHALSRLRKELEIKIVAVHINHMLRGKLADADEAFVKGFCKEFDIPCHTFRVDVDRFASENNMSFEEAGRKVRYEKFNEIFNHYSADRIAIAHNKNDVVETFLINLMRGAGIDGLSSIDYMRDDIIIRPILDVTRVDVEKYCENHELNPRIDHTNNENHYLRNKIRNRVLPMMNETFEQSCGDAIEKTVQLMKIEKDYWLTKQKKLFEELCTYNDEVIKISTQKFCELHLAEQQQLLRYAIKTLSGSLYNIGFDVIQRIIDLERVGAIATINASYMARLSSTDLYLFPVNHIKNPDLQNDNEFTLYQTVVPISQMSKMELNDYKVALDFDKIKGKLYTRNRKAGDRFVPLGMKGHKKIKDYFIDEKVPFLKRETIRLVCDEEKIVWVENMRISDLVKITPDTKNIIIISFQELVELN